MTGQRDILEAWDHLGPDERAVVLAVARRLRMGRQEYGELHLDSDRRDFLREAGEEVLDAVVYLACDLLRGRQPS